MTGPDQSRHRSDPKTRRSLVLVVALVAVLACAGVAAGLIGGAQAESPVRPVTTAPSESALPLVTPAPRATPPHVMPRSVPVRLRIPAIGVDSSLMDLGLTPEGTLETPPGAFPAGWFTGAPTPGEIGPAIIVGHVRYVKPGVFARLTDLKPGDRILVERTDGSTAHFRVTRLANFAKASFPTKLVYGDIDHAGLRLITCGGLDADTNVFEDNVVVFADLDES